jgi:hypothetical protein
MILTGDHTKIVGMIDRMSLEVKGLIQSAIDIATYTRGGVPYETALNMSAFERDLTIESINKRMEAASKSPFGMMSV